MSLKTKSFSEILNSMIGWVTTRSDKITNFRVGSVIRTLLESVSMELETMYFQMHKSFKYAIRQSVLDSFSFSPKPSIPSTGEVLVRFSYPLPYNTVIPKGYKFSTPPKRGNIVYFETIFDTVCESGFTEIGVKVKCTKPGLIGNVPSGAIQVMMTSLPYATSCINLQPFTNGTEAEDLMEVKKRFKEYIQTLAKGTLEAIQYGCMTVPGVAGVYGIESVGVVYLYIHDSNGDLPQGLKDQVQATLLSYRAGGVETVLLPVTKRYVSVDIGIMLAPGFDSQRYTALVREEVTKFLNAYTVSTPLRRADLIKFIMGIDPVAIQNTSISLESDVILTSSEIIRAGTITVEVI